MKKIVLAVLLMVSFQVIAANDPSVTTTLSPDARYEIVQSPLAGKYQFRLDRYTGKTWVLQHDSNNDEIWTECPNYSSLPFISKPSKSRFFITMNGLTAKYMLLLDTETGQTWVAYNQSTGIGVVWYSMPNP